MSLRGNYKFYSLPTRVLSLASYALQFMDLGLVDRSESQLVAFLFDAQEMSRTLEADMEVL